MNRSVDSSQRSAGSLGERKQERSPERAAPISERPTHPSEPWGSPGERRGPNRGQPARPLMRGYAQPPTTYGNTPYPQPTSGDLAAGDAGTVWRGRDERHDFWGYDRRSADHPSFWSRVKGVFHGRGPKNYVRSDERIHEDVCERLSDHPYIDASDIEVIVREGEVTLTGTVEARMVKRAAEEVVEEARGVRDVHNHLRVRRPAPGIGT